jgi:hypothetical protein
MNSPVKRWPMAALLLVAAVFLSLFWVGTRMGRPRAMVGAPLADDVGNATLLPETVADFAWFSTLGFPDLKDRPFGRFPVPAPFNSAPYYFPGFRLDESADGGVAVLGLDLRDYILHPPAPNQPPRSWPFTPDSLKNFADACLQQGRVPPAPSTPAQVLWRATTSVSARADIFILAWACGRQGLAGEAQQLYVLAKYFQPPEKSPDARDADLRVALEKDLGEYFTRSVLGQFRDPAMSRPQLLARMREVLQKYPRSPLSALAQDTAATLARMIAEDQAHVALTPAQLAQLPEDERAREYLYQLRDQRLAGANSFAGGTVNDALFADFPGRADDPLSQLEALHYAALPGLAAALKDDSFTRITRANAEPAQALYRVRDVAAALLARIAGRPVDPEWLAQAQKVGEKQFLIQRLAAGNATTGPDEDALYAAQRLEQRYPDAAGPPLLAATRAAAAAHNPAFRVWLGLLANVGDPPALTYLDEQLRNGEDTRTRVAAATELFKRGQPDALPAMLREWAAVAGRPREPLEGIDYAGLLPNDTTLGQLGDFTRQQRLHNDLRAVIGFLVQTDAPEALDALTRNLRQRPPLTRYDVIYALNFFARPRAGAKPLSLSSLAAIAAATAAELDDADPIPNFGQRLDSTGLIIRNPNVNDILAQRLAELWPEKYSFDLAAPPAARAAQIAQIRAKLGPAP